MTLFIAGTNPTVAEVLEDLDRLLQDTALIRWDEAFRIAALNAAELEIVTLRPDAGANLDVEQLEPGCWQTFDGFALLSVEENLGTDGATPGPVPTRMTKDQLTTMFPSLHDTGVHAPSAQVLAWAYDPRDQRRYLVYPPQPAVDTGYLRIKQATFPPGVSATGDQTFLDRDFKPAIVEYGLYHCFKRDAEHGDYAERAQMHYGQFLSLLGISGKQAQKIARRKEGES